MDLSEVEKVPDSLGALLSGTSSSKKTMVMNVLRNPPTIRIPHWFNQNHIQRYNPENNLPDAPSQ